MNKLLLLFILSIFLISGCKEDENPGPPNFQATWQALGGDAGTIEYWLFLTREDGTLVAEASGQPNDLIVLEANVPDDVQRLDLTQFTKTINLDSATNTLYDSYQYAHTYMDVSTNFEVGNSEFEFGKTRAIQIQGVNTYGEIVWPGGWPVSSDLTVFFNPQANTVNFDVAISDSYPAFIKIRANDETEYRYIWIESVQEDAYTFNYNELEQMIPQSTVNFPNDEVWNFMVLGINGLNYSAPIDFPFFSDGLVQGSYTSSLPTTTDVPSFVLRTLYAVTDAGSNKTYYPTIYEKLLFSLPNEIPLADFSMNAERTTDGVQILIDNDNVSAVELTTELIYNGITPLLWRYYGHPDLFTDFKWEMELPEALEASLKAPATAAQNQKIEVVARQYDTNPTYGEYIRAKASNAVLWDARQGMLGASQLFD